MQAGTYPGGAIMVRMCLLLLFLAGPTQAIELMPAPLRPAPALSVPLATGGWSTLAKLRGRVVLVNFWASWCPACLLELPSMSRLATRMRGRPLVVLAVNAGEPPGWVKGFVSRTQPAFAVGLDPAARAMHAWGAMVMPTSYLIDKAGRIRYTVVGPMAWDSPEMVAIVNTLTAE
jgi:thiol-disulfide isomerase/thioredoxin